MCDDFYLQDPPFSKSILNASVNDYTLSSLVQAQEVNADNFNVYQDNNFPQLLHVRYRANGKMTKRVPMMKPVNYDLQPKNERKYEVIRRFMYLNLLDSSIYQQYLKLVTKLTQSMTLCEVIKTVISCQFYEETDVNQRLEKVLGYISNPSFINLKVCELKYHEYLAFSVMWLCLYFGGGEMIYILDFEGEIPSLNGVPLHGQHLWWLLHIVFLPFQELYRTHIASKVRLTYDAPYPSCFHCGESFAIDYWNHFVTAVEMTTACFDRLILPFYGVKSIESFPVQPTWSQSPISIHKARLLMTEAFFPACGSEDQYEKCVKILEMTQETYLTFKTVLDCERWRGGYFEK